MVVSQLAGHGVLLGCIFPGVQPVVFLRVWAVVNLYKFSLDIFFQIQGRVTPEHSNSTSYKVDKFQIKIKYEF